MKNVLAVFIALVLAGAWGSAQAQQADVQLKDVVVTATKTEKDPKDVTVPVTVITAEEIKKSGALTAGEAVRTVAGLMLKDNGPRGANNTVNIRGSNYAQVLVLLDGKRLNSAQNGGFDLSMLPLAIEDIDRIEVLRGASSALYGADAVGGVVNIITKRPSTTEMRLSAAAGSYGYDHLQAGSSGKEGSTSYAVTGTRETSDGYRVNSDMEQWTVNGNVGYEFSPGASVEFTTNYFTRKQGVPGSLSWLSPKARQDDRNLFSSATYRQKVGNAFDFSVTAARSDEHQYYRDPDAFADSVHNTLSKRGDVQMSWLAGQWSLLTLGYEQRKDDLDSTDSGDRLMENKAWFLQDEIGLGESLIVVFGDRYDKHSMFGNRHSPRASARYFLFGKETIVRVSYGESYRTPTFNDLYWPFLGNPDLQPERAVEYNAGIEQQLGGAGAVKFTWFERKAKNLIDWHENPPGSGIWMVDNIARARITGVEAEARLSLSQIVRLSINYTYTRPIDEVTGEKIYYTIPKEQLNGRCIVDLDANVYLTVEGRMVENYVMPGDPEWHYVVADARVAERFGKKNGTQGEIYFAITNAFDRKYEAVRAYPMPPKEIRGGVTLSF
jgi:outer membrane cobalamin receptor